MANFTGVNRKTSEQHHEEGNAQVKCDTVDTLKLVSFFSKHSPFQHGTTLRNIVTGTVADDRVNCDKAKEIGQQIVKKMEGECVANMKRADRAVPMGTPVKVRDKEVLIDPRVLWQRWTTAGVNSGELGQVLSHELAVFPLSLFETKDVMLSADKASLADYIAGMVGDSPALYAPLPENDNINYIVDGCAQLYRMKWKKGWTYQDICQNYTKLFLRKFPRRRTSVYFDGYKSSTKDATHAKRDMQCQDVEVAATSTCDTARDAFLSNVHNKNTLAIHVGHMLVIHVAKNNLAKDSIGTMRQKYCSLLRQTKHACPESKELTMTILSLE